MLGLFLPDGTIPLFQIMLKLGLYNTRLGCIISMMGVWAGCPLSFFVSYHKGIPVVAQPAISSMAILQAIGVWNDITRAIVFLFNDQLFPITKGLFVFSGLYSVSLYLFVQHYIISGLTASSIKM
jgi:raffinose/stachyose/melibiose transport system permease protein